MSEWFMGQELVQPELPVNSPRPHMTPPEGVIVSDLEADGYLRRYLYKSMGSGRVEQVLISETLQAVAVEEPVLAGARSERPAPVTLGDIGAVEVPLGEAAPEVPNGGDAPVVGDAPVAFGWAKKNNPAAAVQNAAAVMGNGSKPRLVPMPERRTVGMATLVEERPPVEGPVAMGQSEVVELWPSLGQVAPPPVALPYHEAAPDENPLTCDIPVDLDRMIAGDEPRPFNWAKGKQNPLQTNVTLGRQPAPAPASARMSAPVQMSGPRVQTKKIDDHSATMNRVEVQAPLSPLLGEVRLGAFTPPPIDHSGQVAYPAEGIESGHRMIQLDNPALGRSHVPVSSRMASISSAAPFLQNQVQMRGPIELGQVAPTPSAPAGSACPGAIAMPDGRVIEPGDGLSLSDLCEILPLILDALKLKSQTAGGLQNISQQGLGPMGRAGAGGGGGGGFIGSGGGGGRGAVGPQGPAGVAGLGGSVDSITKTDGDFTAGPGAFVAVPGTLINFTTDVAAPALFFLQAVLGTTDGIATNSQSGQLGLRVDGTDYPLSTRLLHTFVGGVGEFLIGQSASLPLTLADGAHTVEVILRGLAPGEFGGAALGTPAAVAATASVPLHLTVSHS